MGLSSERGQIAHRCIKICAHGIPKFTTTAHYLMGLDLPFVNHQPPELRGALLDLAKRMRQIAIRASTSDL